MTTDEKGQRGERLRVLVVDDHADTREALGELLRRWGYEAVVAETAEDALDVLARTRVDVVLTDLLLPGWDGWELARRAREKAAPPVVTVLTGWSVDLDEASVRRRGVDAVLEKPVSPTTLRELLQRYEGRS